jgi:hypothetical protein
MNNKRKKKNISRPFSPLRTLSSTEGKHLWSFSHVTFCRRETLAEYQREEKRQAQGIDSFDFLSTRLGIGYISVKSESSCCKAAPTAMASHCSKNHFFPLHIQYLSGQQFPKSASVLTLFFHFPAL